MRALGMNLVVVCAIVLHCIGCNAKEIYRTKRGVVAGNATSRPKSTIRRSECKDDRHCEEWPNTSCAYDPVNGKYRCFCDDHTHQINDDCITLPQELGMACELDIHCIQLAYCAHNTNDTNSDVKICQCREDYVNEDGTCSGGERAIISVFLAILVVIIFQNN